MKEIRDLKRKFQRFCAMFLVVVLCMPLTTFAGETVQNEKATTIKYAGADGASINYYVFDTGELHVKGSGNCAKRNWKNYSYMITSAWVSISAITDLSTFFSDYELITVVDFSPTDISQLTTAEGMFDNCPNLTKVIAPENASGQQILLPVVEGYYWVYEGGTEAVTEITAAGTYTRLKEPKYSGVSGDLNWSIDDYGHLKIWGTGDYESASSDFDAPPWCVYADEIFTASVSVNGITSTSDMFCGCTEMTSIDLENLDTSMVTDMSRMFIACEKLTGLDVSKFKTENVTNMANLFMECKALEKLDVTGFKTGNVTSMCGMFNGCSSLKKIDVTGFDTSRVYDMGQMFYDCRALEELDLRNFDTSNVMSIGGMFYCCWGLKTLDLSNFDVSKVEYFTSMFECCKFERLDLSSFHTTSAKGFFAMFDACGELQWLDISNFDTTNVEIMTRMFRICNSLTYINAPENKSSQEMILPEGYEWKYVPTGEVVTNITKAGVYMRSDAMPPEEKVEPKPAEKGTQLTDENSGGAYKVTNDNAQNPEVSYIAPTGKKMTSVVIPEYVTYQGITYKVTTVAAKAFKGNKKLKNISIATSITKIGKDAFSGCANLKTVTIGKSLKSIGANAFKNCKKLTKVTIKSKKLATIGNSAFSNCTALKTLTLNSTKLTSIGKSAFENCKQLYKITLKSKKLKKVGKNALKDVKANCKIVVPKAQVKKYAKLFKNKGLKTVKVTK